MKSFLIVTAASFLLTACGVDGAKKESSQEPADALPTTEKVVRKEETSTTASDAHNAKKESLQPDFTGKRESAYEAVETFLEVVINEDTKDIADYEIRKERRERLQPFVTEALLKEFEPTDEELTEQGFPIPSDDFEYDETVSPVHNLMEHETILESRNIYIDEASIPTDTIYIIADAFYTYKTDFEGSIDEYDEASIYKFTLEAPEEHLMITEYEVLENGRLLPEDQRPDYSEFYK